MEDTITNGPPAPSKMSQDAVMEHAKTGGSPTMEKSLQTALKAK
jgi:hypothetical protein